MNNRITLLYVVLLFCFITTYCASAVLNLNVSEADPMQIENENEVHNLNRASDLEPSLEDSGDFTKKPDSVSFSSSLFEEVSTQNSGITNDNGPIPVTLTDTAAAELQEKAKILPISVETLATVKPNSSTTDHSKENETEQTFTEVDSAEVTVNVSTQSIELDNISAKANLTEEIPSFSEWAQKQLEAEKSKEIINVSSITQTSNGKQGSGAKLRSKNYASLDCGAKVVASNPESVSPGSILSPLRDEYKLSPCTSRIWFIVELCEAIQAKKIDFANFELFSSSPKEFTVGVSDRFPTRDWSNVGHFTAKDERNIQSFDLYPQLFGKYIKVEVKNHYGSEHYCPLSLFRVYGTSEFEVLQKEDHVNVLEDEDEDDNDDDEQLDIDSGDASKNLFSSATDAVISIVKKAAEVLGNKSNQSQVIEKNNTSIHNHTLLQNNCFTYLYTIICDNCTESFMDNVYQLLNCKYSLVENYLKIPLIKNGLSDTTICQQYGFSFSEKNNYYIYPTFVISVIPDTMLCAMCNVFAALEEKAVYNVTYQYYKNETVINDEKLIHIDTSMPLIISNINSQNTKDIEDAQSSVEFQISDNDLKASCSTDISYLLQIKPTKTLTTDIVQNKSVNEEVNYVASTASTTITDTNEFITLSSESLEKVDDNKNIRIGLNSENNENKIQVENNNGSIENIDEQIDNLIISELNGNTNQLPINAPNSIQQQHQGQKESVFLRLSNRIKILERNMSLSSQYLEELSKRYKKQVEEMQKSFEKSMNVLNEDNKRKDERNKQLEERLNEISKIVDNLMLERNSWLSTYYFISIILFLSVVILMFCWRNSDRNDNHRNDNSLIKNERPQRRKSIDVITHNAPPKKKRRPSDQALKIVRSSIVSEQNYNNGTIKEKKKKRKKSVHSRSNSANAQQMEFITSNNSINNREKSKSVENKTNDWIEKVKTLEEIPIYLEESDHSTLESFEHSQSSNDLKTYLHQNNDNEVLNTIINPIIYVNGNTKLVSNSDESLQQLKKEKKGIKRILKKVF